MLLGACATGQLIDSLHKGMDTPDVVSILGSPDDYARKGNYEALKYKNRHTSGWLGTRTDYGVILRHGKVVAYGNGQVEETPNKLILVPIKHN
jgi:hypothetical protein